VTGVVAGGVGGKAGTPIGLAIGGGGMIGAPVMTIGGLGTVGEPELKTGWSMPGTDGGTGAGPTGGPGSTGCSQVSDAAT
jgi:hypothetical protein